MSESVHIHPLTIGLETQEIQYAVENALIDRNLCNELGNAIALLKYGTVLDIAFSNQKWAEVDRVLAEYRPSGTKLAVIFDRHNTDNSARTIYAGHDHSGIPLILEIRLYGSSAYIWVASKLAATMQHIAKQYSALLAAIIENDENRVTISASYLNAKKNVVRFTTSAVCPLWSVIAENYAPEARTVLTEVMNLPAISGGRLLIWHGEPGTGKSYAIRALMREWNSRHKPVIVTDPDAFLEHSLYYYGLLQEYPNEPMLLILEDAATGLLKETRAHRSSWVGRLLNMTDGILTEGRQDIFLLTFNEKFDGLDPAVIRPGRCLAKIEFPKLSQEQANTWLRNKGTDSEVGEDVTLAELYQRLRGKKRLYQASVTNPLGFDVDQEVGRRR